MDGNVLLRAFRMRDHPAVAAAVGIEGLRDSKRANRFVELVRQSGSLVVKMPDHRQEKKRDDLLVACRKLLAANTDADTALDFENHTEDARLVEPAFREIVQTLRASLIGNKAPDVRAWAAIGRAVLELEYLREKQEAQLQNLATTKASFLNIAAMDVKAEDGTRVNVDAVVTSITTGLWLTLTSLAFENKWFDEHGLVILPPKVTIDDEVLSQAGTDTVLAMQWRKLERAWDRSRLFRSRFSVHSETALLPSGENIKIDILTTDPPSLFEIEMRVAEDRMLHSYVINMMELNTFGAKKHIVHALDSGKVPLPPDAYLSNEEFLAAEMLTQTFCIPFERDDLFFDLSLRVWLRGYAVLCAIVPKNLSHNVSTIDIAENELVAKLCGVGITEAQALRFIDHVSLRRGSKDLFDTPLIRCADGNLQFFAPAYRAPNLWNILLSRLSSLGRLRDENGEQFEICSFEKKGLHFEKVMLALCTEAGLEARSFGYKHEGVMYQCDLAFLLGQTLFVCDCKNYVLSFGHIPTLYYFSHHLNEFRHQIFRITEQFTQNPEILRREFGAKAHWNRIIPVVLQAMPWSTGRIGDVYFYDASAFRRLLKDGSIDFTAVTTIGSHKIQRRHRYMLRHGDIPTDEEFLRELNDPAQVRLGKLGWTCRAEAIPISDRMAVHLPELVRDMVGIEEQLNALGSTPEEATSLIEEFTKGLPVAINRRKTERARIPQPRSKVRIRRNAPCPCGSGQMFKKCCRSYYGIDQ
ncbi:MAG: YecA family protein [Verrucomicrobiales bacterium]